MPRHYLSYAKIIEHGTQTRKYEVAGLKEAGYKVNLAKAGLEGLDARYDQLIVDRTLPGFDDLTWVKNCIAQTALCRYCF
jgi:DNA-binding response OmpR family regulator